MARFEHKQYAHCESGVIATMFTQKGLRLSEPMAFGLTSSLSFVYLPFIKISNMPLIAYRMLPKNIVNNIAKILNASIVTKRFKTKEDATNALNALLEEGKIVGLQTSVFYLPYFPKDMRFHFNAHNLIVYDKTEGGYRISDPVFEQSVECDEAGLLNARFAKGIFAPKGFLYYIDRIDANALTKEKLQKAIKKNAKIMLSPFPLGGVKGMNVLANAIAKVRSKDARYQKNFLTHIVRMQEEIGTGGGGFRYLYAAFLDEAKAYGLDATKLDRAKELLIDSGNALRQCALLCVQAAKNTENYDADAIANKMREASLFEKEAFSLLKTL
jgi:hypothetical protein